MKETSMKRRLKNKEATIGSWITIVTLLSLR